MLAVGGCSSSGGAANQSSGGAGQQAPAAGDNSSSDSAALAALYKGSLTSPSTASRPAVKGKKIVIISAGQSSISSSIPVNAAAQAARAIGWNVSIYDAKLNPANAPGLVSQAISSGADAIIVDAIDCPQARSGFQQAKAKKIPVVGIYSFDCNDPIFGRQQAGSALFTSFIDYGVAKREGIDVRNVNALTKAYDDYTEEYGKKQADAVIAATHGKARVIYFNDSEVTILKYTGKGFLDEMAKCGGCKIVDKVDFLQTELGSTLQQKATAALMQHPDANAVKSPYTTASILGIAPAVVASGRDSSIYSMGGEGFAPELDLMRAHQGIDAVEYTPSDWTGWAAVDTLNSTFRHQLPAFSGLGNVLIDPTHGLPSSGAYQLKIDYQAVYKKAWGVG